jgi:chromosome segregation ATPase
LFKVTFLIQNKKKEMSVTYTPIQKKCEESHQLINFSDSGSKDVNKKRPIIDIDDQSAAASSLAINLAKRMNTSTTNSASNSTTNSPSSMNRFEAHMHESELKACMIKISSLNQTIQTSIDENARLQAEIKRNEEKYTKELNTLKEQKHTLEMSLKSVKSNEQLLNGEMEFLRKKTETLQNDQLPEKDKLIEKLELKIKELTNDTKATSNDSQKLIADLKYDVDTKQMEIDILSKELNISKK